MKTPPGPFFGRRLPFLALLGAAVIGILAGEYTPLPTLVWLGLVLTAGLGFAARLRGTFYLFVAAAFAWLHGGQTRSAPGALVADWLGNRTPLVFATGVVDSEPRVFVEGRASFDFRVSRLEAAGSKADVSFPLLVNWNGAPPAYGDELRLRGVLANLPGPRNPGQFDFASWQKRQGIYSNLTVQHPYDAQLLASDQGSALVAFSLRAKAWLAERIGLGIADPTVADLLRAMVLGDVSALPESVQEEFRGTGTFHLFSVSGLHVGILALILWQVLRVAQVPRPAAAAIIIPLLFFYALMTGMKPASVRAAVMGSIILVGFLAQRKPLLFNNLCAAGFLILLADTNQLFNAGFQLSFTVVAAILLLGDRFKALLEKPFQPDPFFPPKLLSPQRRFLWEQSQQFSSLAGVSLAAWIGSFPLTLGYFHLISLSALPANLIAVPLSFFIMATAALAVGGSMISPWLGEIFNQCNWLQTKLLLAVVHFFASLPTSYLYVPPVAAPTAEAVIFDFGAGGSCWVRAGGRAWLIDAGPARLHDSTLLPFLRSQGRLRLDGVVLTHGDARHIGAVEALLASCPPARILDSPLDDRSPTRGRLHRLLAETGQPKTLCRAGDGFSLAPEATLQVLFPPSDLSAGTADDKAMVLLLTIRGTRLLLLSDAGPPTEGWLLRQVRDRLACDILIRGAHRSGLPPEPEFLDAARPAVIVSTSAAFPATVAIPPSWAAGLAERGIRLFRQDECGAVTIRFFSDGYEVSGFVNKQYDRRFR